MVISLYFGGFFSDTNSFIGPYNLVNFDDPCTKKV
ncbi:hypothetical protein LINPERPRIM_LOCUS28517, partial [Linum perenne]